MASHNHAFHLTASRQMNAIVRRDASRLDERRGCALRHFTARFAREALTNQAVRTDPSSSCPKAYGFGTTRRAAHPRRCIKGEGENEESVFVVHFNFDNI